MTLQSQGLPAGDAAEIAQLRKEELDDIPPISERDPRYDFCSCFMSVTSVTNVPPPFNVNTNSWLFFDSTPRPDGGFLIFGRVVNGQVLYGYNSTPTLLPLPSLLPIQNSQFHLMAIIDFT